MIYIKEFDEKYNKNLMQFLRKCLLQSGRKLDLQGRHKIYCNISQSFECFWCMLDDEDIIGTVALKKLNSESCELKSLYLLENYHGVGLGYRLLMQAICFAKQFGYEEMYLDSLSTSKKALDLYGKVGFVQTERYNQNQAADVFMVLKL